MRAGLSILSDIAQKGETENISKKKQRIKRKYRIRTKQELQTIRESLKMKIQAKAQRIRRYVKRSKQYRKNQMFSNNRKTFLRNLSNDQILVEKPPNKEATETFWRNILESDREHNHSVEWIRREEQKYADTKFQSWVDISQEELQTALKKTSNWKSAGLDVPNFWLKQLTALHPHLLNAYNQAKNIQKTSQLGLQQHKHIYWQRYRESQELQTNCLLINIVLSVNIDFNRKKLLPCDKK